MKKKMVTVLAIVLVVALSVAGTYAYLTDHTGPVKNTFAMAGLVDEGGFTLDESLAVKNTTNGSYTLNTAERVQENSYTVIPGVNLPKDPTIHLDLADNMEAYLFLVVKDTLGTGLTATIDSEWGAPIAYVVDGEVRCPVYAQKVASTGTVKDYNILAGTQIVADTDADKTYSGEIEFNAYLTQAGSFEDAADAWTNTFGATK